MNKENLTLEQRAKNAVKSNKSQAWKVAVISAMGLAVGGGVAAATILPKDDDNVDEAEDAKQEEQEKDVEIVQNHSHVTNNTTPKPAPVDNGDDDVSLPDYIVYEQQVVTLTNGSQAEVAWGVTENGNDCVLIDDDMDGRANRFIEDTNSDGLIEKAETIDLADNDIAISMEHLPSLDITVVVPEENSNLEAYVVDDDPNVNIDSDDIVDVDFNPDFNTTDTYDVASNDDIVADPNDNIMA